MLARLAIAIAVVGAIAAPRAAAAAPIRIASLAPTDSEWGKLLTELAADVAKETKGEVDFKLYLGGTQGDENKVFKKLDRGLDGAVFTGLGLGMILPASRVIELPFLFRDFAEVDAVREAVWPEMQKMFWDKTDFAMLLLGETGNIHIFSKLPISNVEELRAAKPWAWEGDRVVSEIFRAYGVSPRPLDILTVIQQLKTGGIDTVYNSPAGLIALGWSGDVKYVTERAFAYVAGGLVLTKRTFARIPEPLQPTVKAVCERYGKRLTQQARQDNARALQRLTAPGGGLSKVVTPEAQFRELAKVGEAAYPKLVGMLEGQALYERVQQVLKTVRR